MRLPCLILLTAVAAAMAGCGGGSPSAPPPGSPENPLVATTPAPAAGGAADPDPDAPAATGSDEGSTASKESNAEPSDHERAERRSRPPRSRFTPCSLVTKAQAGAIVGEPIEEPREAPQGPTCIYRSRTGKQFVTLAVLSVEFTALQRQIRRRERVDVASRTAYCGTYGQPMLYVPLSHGRVLSVAAPCPVAKRFATTALQRLTA